MCLVRARKHVCEGVYMTMGPKMSVSVCVVVCVCVCVCVCSTYLCRFCDWVPVHTRTDSREGYCFQILFIG